MPLAAAFLSATLPAAIVETLLTNLAGLFLAGANGDMTAARQAAAQMLAAYHPQTEPELSLAAQIVSCSFHALNALGQAAAPDLSLTRILRLRGSAVSLSRERHKAQRQLDQLQKARDNAISAQASSEHTNPARAQPEPNIAAAETAHANETPDTTQSPPPLQAIVPTPTHDQLAQDARIAASLKRAEARVAAQQAIATPDKIPLDGPATAQAA